MGLFNWRKPTPEPEPEEPLGPAPIDLLSDRLEEFARTARVAQAELEVQLAGLQLQIVTVRDRLQNVVLAVEGLQSRLQATGRELSLRMDHLDDRSSLHGDVLNSLGTAIEELRRKHSDTCNQLRQNEIAIQQVAQQRGGGGIAGIA